MKRVDSREVSYISDNESDKENMQMPQLIFPSPCLFAEGNNRNIFRQRGGAFNNDSTDSSATFSSIILSNASFIIEDVDDISDLDEDKENRPPNLASSESSESFSDDSESESDLSFEKVGRYARDSLEKHGSRGEWRALFHGQVSPDAPLALKEAITATMKK